jgi:hypothetical protein
VPIASQTKKKKKNYGLDGKGVGVRVPVRTRYLSFNVVQIGYRAHPVFYQLGTWGSFPGDVKVTIHFIFTFQSKVVPVLN